MYRNVVSRRDQVIVAAGLSRGRKLLGLAGAVQARPEQVALRRVVRRSVVVKPTSGNIYFLCAYDVEAPRSDALDVRSISRNRVDVPPAIPLTRPKKPLSFIQPFCIATRQTLLVPIQVSPGYV